MLAGPRWEVEEELSTRGEGRCCGIKKKAYDRDAVHEFECRVQSEAFAVRQWLMLYIHRPLLLGGVLVVVALSEW